MYHKKCGLAFGHDLHPGDIGGVLSARVDIESQSAIRQRHTGESRAIDRHTYIRTTESPKYGAPVSALQMAGIWPDA